jgi:hypothetical protein
MSKKHRPMTWWMCLNPYLEGDKPEVRHSTFAEAQEEARRLCVRTGRKIHVLKCVGTYHAPQIPQPVWEDRDYWSNSTFYVSGAPLKSQISKP